MGKIFQQISKKLLTSVFDCAIILSAWVKPELNERRREMKLYACRKEKKDGSGTYLCIEARASWGKIIITFDTRVILELLPMGTDHRKLTADGVEIGSIKE